MPLSPLTRPFTANRVMREVSGASNARCPKLQTVLGAVRPEGRLPLPAVRRGVMRKEKGGVGGLGPTHAIPLPAVRRGVML